MSSDVLRHFTDGIVHIWKYEGLRQLWAGTLPGLMLVANPAIQLMTYESIKRRVNRSLGGTQPSAWIFLAIGAISKMIATTLTYPLQLVQTKLRVYRTHDLSIHLKREIDASIYTGSSCDLD